MDRLLASLLLCCALLLPATTIADPGMAPRPRIALIIDDLGYALAAGRRAVSLPGPVACAVLPGTPRGRELAELAVAEEKEVLLHLPLEPQGDDRATDPGLLHLDMSEGEFATTLAGHLAELPQASGVNNHRGSLLTRHPGHMGWLMRELSRHPELFFVDSYTTHRSVALQLARETGVPAVRRDVFLDDERSEAAIRAEFERLKRLARAKGSAVGIGHPYPETLDFLERALPQLAAEGFDLVPLRSLLPASAHGDD